MKTWLRQNKSRLLAAALAVLTFLMGWCAGQSSTDQRAYAALWEAMVTLPDPERCALCGQITRHHALYLIDLSTGQMGRLTVYDTDPERPWEVLPMDKQPTGTFQFQPCAGLTGVRDTGAYVCMVTLPEELAPMNPALFCRDHRVLLAGAGLEGYAILDSYDPDGVRAYSVREGNRQVIRDYRVTVKQEPGGWALWVTGSL